MSELSLGTLSGLAANSFVVDVAAGSTLDLSAGAVFPAGSILQVVSATKTDTFTVSSITETDVTGLSATITPASATSKVFVTASVQVGANITYVFAGLRLVRDATPIAIGDAAGSRVQAGASVSPTYGSTMASVTMSTLDTPATASAVTYKVQLRADRTAHAVYVNRSDTDVNSNVGARAASTITVWEIAG